MEDVIAIFPSRGLDNSILVPIFIGLLIHGFFIESLGWSFAGLVVPGYLASVFVIAPQAGIVIILEILTTFFVVYIVSELLARLGWWHSFFGRDRFLAFFVVSLLVRLVYEVWFFQTIADAAIGFFGLPLETSQHLYGIGLVIVPLASHAMWRAGLRRGMLQIGVPVFLTWLILTQLLIPYTNFSIANFELTFQDLALDFTNSPKIYITLIVGMLIAARLNLSLGWDFNGIMVPSLLAIAWYMPLKILTTIVEASLIVAVAWLIALLPIFRRSNLEGTRRLLLIFTVGLALKFGVGAYFEEMNPGFKVSDLFGFGYLLPSLIALNIWEHRSWSLVIGPTLVTSFGAFLVGNVIGLGLFQVDKLFVEEIAAAEDRPDISVQIAESPVETLQLAAVSTLPVLPETFSPTSSANRVRFQRILTAAHHLARNAQPGNEPEWITQEFAKDLRRLHLELVWVTQAESKRKLLVLREPTDGALGQLRGWGTVVFTPGCKDGVILEVPFPGEEPETVDTAFYLHERLNSCALAINGWRTFRPGETAVLRRIGSPFALVHELLARQPIVQIRTWKNATTVFIENRVPQAFDLETIKATFPDYRLSWRAYDHERPGVDLGFSDQIELVINAAETRRLWPAVELPAYEPEQPSGLAWLRDKLNDPSDWIAEAGSQSYRQPSALEMDYLTRRIVRPLRDILSRLNTAATADPKRDLDSQLGLIRHRAAALGYALEVFNHGPHQLEVALYEPVPTRFWGLYLFRSQAERWAVEVPRPLLESGALEIAFNSYGRLNAAALLIAGADLDARGDGLANITALDNPVNPFQAVHRGLYPVQAALPAPWIVQIRGRAGLHGDLAPVLISTGDDLQPNSPRDAMLVNLLDDLDNLAIGWELFNSARPQLGLKGVDNLQLRYSNSLQPQSMALLWYSQTLRATIPASESQARSLRTIRRDAIDERQTSLEAVLGLMAASPISSDLQTVNDRLRDFVRFGDPGYWFAATQQAPGQIARTLIVDSQSGKAFILLHDTKSMLKCLIRLERPGATVVYTENRDSEASLQALRYGAIGSFCSGEVAP